MSDWYRWLSDDWSFFRCLENRSAKSELGLLFILRPYGLSVEDTLTRARSVARSVVDVNTVALPLNFSPFINACLNTANLRPTCSLRVLALHSITLLHK